MESELLKRILERLSSKGEKGEDGSENVSVTITGTVGKVWEFLKPFSSEKSRGGIARPPGRDPSRL